MSEMTTNTLRPADNTVTLEGVLKEKKLRHITNDNGEFVSGDLIIATEPGNEHTVSVFVNRMTRGTKDRPAEESRAWKGIVRVMEEYRSIAELMQGGATEEEAKTNATHIFISDRSGSIRLNEYYGRDGELHSEPRINAQYFTRVDLANYKPQNPHFEMECFLDKMIPEFKGEEETGRLFLDVLVPSYGGRIMPMRLVTTKEAGAYIADHYEPKRTIHVYGNMVNAVTTVETRKSGFIKEEVTTTTTRVREMVVDNGDESPYDEENAKAYKLGDIQAAVRVRETEELPRLKARQEEQSTRRTAPTSGFSNPARNASATSSPSGQFTFNDIDY